MCRSPVQVRSVRRIQFAAYTLAVAHELTAQLARIAALPPAQLVGHAANFDFWCDEVAHCLSVIDNYPARFDRMCAAERGFLQREPLPDFRHGEPFIPARVPSAPGRLTDELRRYMRAEVCRAFVRFAIACYQRAQLDAQCIREHAQRLGIEIADCDVPSVG